MRLKVVARLFHRLTLWPMNSAERKLLAEAFDEAHYRASYPDVAEKGVDPLSHYIRFGAWEGRNPTPWFSTLDYIRQRPDVAVARINPFLHYLTHETKGTRIRYNHGAYRARQEQIIREYFDEEYYLSRYNDLDYSLDLVEHYIYHGASEKRDPTDYFSTKYYMERYPEVSASKLNPFFHYLTIGKGLGYAPSPHSAGDPAFDALCRTLDADPECLADHFRAKRQDITERLRSGTLADLVAKAAELEPLVRHPVNTERQIKIPPMIDGPLQLIGAMRDLHARAQFRRADYVVIIPHCRMSGAARVAGELANALCEIGGADRVLVIRTDLPDFEHPEWFPEVARSIDFASCSEGLEQAHRKSLLFMFLRSLRPKVVFNVNSRLFWDMAANYGKALSADTRIFAYLFCADRTKDGFETGYPIEFFYRALEYDAHFLTDSEVLARALRARYGLTEVVGADRVVTLATPVHSPLEIIRGLVGAPHTGRPKVFWAGRFDRQKRVDVVLEIARRMPDVEFHLWGKSVLDDGVGKLGVSSNVALQGTYDDFSNLPLQACDLWLYTSEWDGVPTLLLDVVATGIPLVTSCAGGVADVVDERFCYVVRDVNDVERFVQAIRSILDDPEDAISRAGRLRDVTLKKRAPEIYVSAVKALIQESPDARH